MRGGPGCLPWVPGGPGPQNCRVGLLNKRMNEEEATSVCSIRIALQAPLCSGSQSRVLGPRASAPPGNVLEMNIISSHHHPTTLQTGNSGAGPSNLRTGSMVPASPGACWVTAPCPASGSLPSPFCPWEAEARVLLCFQFGPTKPVSPSASCPPNGMDYGLPWREA